MQRFFSTGSNPVQESTQEAIAKDPMRWRMLMLAAMAYACFGLTLASIPPLVEPIIKDLGMNSGEMGLVLGVWQLVFIGTSSTAGSFVDRWGIRRAITIGLVLILLSMLLRGLATDFVTLLLAVAVLGAGGPIVAVGMPKVVAQWFTGNERGIATGLYTIGRDSGTVFSLATAASFVLPLTGTWRGISIVYGVMVLAAIILWVAFSKDAKPVAAVPEAAHAAGANESADKSAIMKLLKIRNIQLVMLLGFAVFFVNHAFNAWLPTVLEEGGMSLTASGHWTAAGVAIGMISNLAVPSLARHGLRSRWLTAILAGNALTTIGLLYLSGPGLIAAALLCTFIRSPALQVLTLVLMETPGVGAKRIGAVAGVFFAIAEIGGFTGPLTLGIVRDSTGSLAAGLGIVVAITATSAFLPLLIRERSEN